jgi:DNA-binding transcriptional MerR regulator
LTISALAKASGLSRSALLYYDRLGLLRARRRNKANYRLYSAGDLERLRRICAHRRMGIPLKEILTLLDESGENAAVEILQRRLETLGREIETLRHQQHCIARILKLKVIHEELDMVTKERWVEIMRAAGLEDRDMHNWHIQFEKMEPEAHQEFLQSLGIDAEEIAGIREWSRASKMS